MEMRDCYALDKEGIDGCLDSLRVQSFVPAKAKQWMRAPGCHSDGFCFTRILVSAFHASAKAATADQTPVLSLISSTSMAR